ncbi:MAG: hypothetical protein J6S60_10215 [Oscillospiraceae bacterium]|nr:hypothetical protein [Oscillospiraceae bacterium]
MSISDAAFILALVILLPAMLMVFGKIFSMGLEAIHEGKLGLGLGIIGMIVLIVAAALPWYLL